MGVHMEGESAMPMMLSKVGAAQYILCCSFTWWLPIASEREHRCAGHSGRHSSPMDPSLFSLNTSAFNSRSSNKKWRFQPKLTVKSVYFYKRRNTSCPDKTSQMKQISVWYKYCGLHLYIRCTRSNIKTLILAAFCVFLTSVSARGSYFCIIWLR